MQLSKDLIEAIYIEKTEIDGKNFYAYTVEFTENGIGHSGIRFKTQHVDYEFVKSGYFNEMKWFEDAFDVEWDETKIIWISRYENSIYNEYKEFEKHVFIRKHNEQLEGRVAVLEEMVADLNERIEEGKGK